MTKALLALGAAAAALIAVPATAKHYTNKVVCTKWHHGNCVTWKRMTRAEAHRVAAYRVGYRFGPSYTFTPVAALPHPLVVRYDLSPDYRYVYRDNYIYVVDPKTYAVTRIIDALTH